MIGCVLEYGGFGCREISKYRIIQLLTLNASGNETYEARRLDTREILMISTTPEIYNAIPYQRPEETQIRQTRSMERRQARQIDIDWDEVEEYFEELGNEIAETVTEVYRSVVNTLSSSLDAIVDALQGVYSAVMEGVRMVMGGLMAAAGFLSKLFRDVLTLLMDLGQKLLGVIMDIIELVAKILSFILKMMAEIIGYYFRMLVSAAGTAISGIVDIVDIGGGFKLSFCLSILTIDVSVCVKYIFVDSLGFDIPHLLVSFSLSTQQGGRRMWRAQEGNGLSIGFAAKISALFHTDLSSVVTGEFRGGELSDEEKEIAEEAVASLDIKHMLLTFGEICLAETLHHITIPPMGIVSETHPEYGVPGFLVGWSSLFGVCLVKLFMTQEHKCSEYLGVLLASLLFLFVDIYLLHSMRSVPKVKEFRGDCYNVVRDLATESLKKQKRFGKMLCEYKWSVFLAMAFAGISFILAVYTSIVDEQSYDSRANIIDFPYIYDHNYILLRLFAHNDSYYEEVRQKFC